MCEKLHKNGCLFLTVALKLNANIILMLANASNSATSELNFDEKFLDWHSVIIIILLIFTYYTFLIQFKLLTLSCRYCMLANRKLAKTFCAQSLVKWWKIRTVVIAIE